MKRLLFAASVALALAASASAQQMPMPAQPAQAGCADGSCANGGCADGKCQKSGWISLKGLFHRSSSGHFNKHQFAPPPPVADTGTLAFPHHPYVRSPRDWFMQD